MSKDKVKSPAYQHYYKEWYGGTRIFTRQQRDIYRDLLDFSYDQDGLRNDLQELENLCQCRTSSEKKDLRTILQKKFYLDEQNMWRNNRLEEVRSEQIAYRQKQKQNGSKGGRPKNPKESQIKPTGFENENPNRTQSKPLQSSSSTSNTDTPLTPQGELGGGEMPEELKIKARQVAVFFKIGEVEQYQRFSEICNFIICLNHRKRLDFFLKQFASYLIYLRQQKDFKGYGLNKFMGSGPQYFEDGAWNDRDWSQSVKPVKTVLTKAKNHQ